VKPTGAPIALCLLAIACGPVPIAPSERPESQRDRQGLAPLASPCVFTVATGAMVITLAASEQGFLEKRASDSALLINGDTCNAVGGAIARSTTALSATITGDVNGGETLVLDYLNGPFLKGTALAPGLVIDLAGGGTDVVQVRMSPLKETVRAGSNGWDISGDGLRDFTLANVDSVVVTLGDGDDVFSAQGGGSLGGPTPSTLPLTVYGGPGNDTLTGGDGNDTLYGDVGDDTLCGGTSLTDGDVYSGGAGTDTVTYAGRTGAVTITVGAGANDGFGSETDDITADVEIVVGGNGDDSFTGWTGPQTFYGGPGDDTFHMGLLASTGAGADTILGEAGEDTADYGARLEAVTVTMDLNVANDGAAGEGDNVHSDVERFICPTAAVVCNVTGNALDNRITGGGGADVLNGGAGDDTFVMGANGGIGAGADVLIGGPGVDVVDFTSFGAALDVRMDDVASVTQSKRIGLDVENLICPGATACTVTGNALNNHLWGSTQADTLSGGGGDDFIETNGGADVVDCGDGSDILIGAGASVVGTTCEL
jgi:Ca2+-binding RTX toxin-like protein